MAVEPAYRGTGVGALVFAGALGIARSRGDDVLWCNARTSARGSTSARACGSRGRSSSQAETGLPHFLMWRPVRD